MKTHLKPIARKLCWHGIITVFEIDTFNFWGAATFATEPFATDPFTTGIFTTELFGHLYTLATGIFATDTLSPPEHFATYTFSPPEPKYCIIKKIVKILG